MFLNEKMLKIPLEAKVSLLFGILAFLVSLLFGILAGNKIGILFSRTLFFTAVYAALGYGSLLIVKRLVPEIYEALQQSLETTATTAVQEELVSVKPESDSVSDSQGIDNQEYSDYTSDTQTITTSNNKVFTPLDAKDFANLSTNGAKPKKMGKHIVVDDKKIQYEPKIMAEAIRTMLKRDKD